MPGNKISNASANDSFAVLFTHLELRREFTEDYMKVRKKQDGELLIIGL